MLSCAPGVACSRTAKPPWARSRRPAIAFPYNRTDGSGSASPKCSGGQARLGRCIRRHPPTAGRASSWPRCGARPGRDIPPSDGVGVKDHLLSAQDMLGPSRRSGPRFAGKGQIGPHSRRPPRPALSQVGSVQLIRLRIADPNCPGHEVALDMPGSGRGALQMWSGQRSTRRSRLDRRTNVSQDGCGAAPAERFGVTPFRQSRWAGDTWSHPCYKGASRSNLQHPRDGGTISAHAQQARRSMASMGSFPSRRSFS